MSSPEPGFACDAMLGGLARWLRAAGYDASWTPGIDDRDLVRQAQQEGLILLTSDSKILLYRVIRDGHVRALWIPLGLDIQKQLAFVLKKLNLNLRESRCMACGGQLIEAIREQVQDQVPPRTLAWQDRFWQCRRCRQVFWHGTHWQRIEQRLREAASGSSEP